MITSNFIEIFSKLIEIDSKYLTKDLKLYEQIAWDSIAVLSTISIIEKSFNKSLSIEQVLLCQDFGSLLALIELNKE